MVTLTAAAAIAACGCLASQRTATAGRDSDASVAAVRLQAKVDELSAALAQLQQTQTTGPRHETTSQPVEIGGTGNSQTQTRAEATQQGGINLSYVVGGSAGLGLTLLARELFHKWMDDRQDARVGEATERMFIGLLAMQLELISSMKAKA